jgi:thioredoxin reductase (NADPH)
MWDLIIIGAGPAGLTSGIYAGNRGLKTIILDSAEPGGLLSSMYPTKVIKNIPGYPEGILAKDFAEKLVTQARSAGAELRRERVVELKIGEERIAVTDEGEYSGRAMILAVGASPRRLGVPGEDKFARKGYVSYDVSQPDEFSGKKTLVVGGGNTALEAALSLAEITDVTLIHRRDRFRASEDLVKSVEESKVKVLFRTELKEVRGEKELSSVLLINNQTMEERELPVERVVLALGLAPNTEIFKRIGLELTQEGYIITDKEQRTNIAGIFAAGDATAIFNQICVACGQGAVAANNAYKYIKKPYWA